MGIIDYIPLTTQLGPPWHMASEFISQVKNTEFSVHYYYENGVRKMHRTFNTPVGTLTADVRASLGEGSEHISKYYISSPEDYKIMKYIVENTVFSKNEQTYLTHCHELGEDGVVLGRLDRNPYQKLMLELVGPENFLIDLYTDPEPVLELMDAMYKRMDEEYEMALESSAKILWMPDNVTADMTPPDCFTKYLLPYYQKYTKLAHQAGKTVVAHFDGKIKNLSTLIMESGIDTLESVSNPNIGGDMTYLEARQSFPGKVIIPNFPAYLVYEKKEEIEDYIKNICKDAQGRPFMLQVSEDLPGDKYETILPIIAEAMK